MKKYYLSLIFLFCALVSFTYWSYASGGSMQALQTGTLRNLLICTVNTSGSGSQDIAIAANDVEIASVGYYIKSTVLGVVSSSIVTDDTAPVTILGTTLLASLTGGKNLVPYETPFFLGSGKKIKIIHVGTASGGTVLVGIEYFKGYGDITCL